MRVNHAVELAGRVSPLSLRVQMERVQMDSLLRAEHPISPLVVEIGAQGVEVSSP